MATPYDPNYPVAIDLGTKQDSPTPIGGKKGKADKSYPTLYISGDADLSKIPASGYALIEFDRESISLRKSGAGKDTPSASVELKVKMLCLPEGEAGDLKDEFAKFAKKSGVDTEGMGSADDEEATEPDTDEGETADDGGSDEEEES